MCIFWKKNIFALTKNISLMSIFVHIVHASMSGVGNSFWPTGHTGNKIVYAGLYQYHMDLFDLIFLNI